MSGPASAISRLDGDTDATVSSGLLVRSTNSLLQPDQRECSLATCFRTKVSEAAEAAEAAEAEAAEVAKVAKV